MSLRSPGELQHKHAQHVDLTFDDPGMVELAARQHFVVARRQLFALGFTRMAIETRIARSTLVRVHHAVYGLGCVPVVAGGRWMAAVLACGEGAVLSHASAAALHDLRGVPSGPIDVTAPGRHRRAGIRAHRAPRRPTTTVDGIPVTTIEQTLVDLAATEPRQRLRTQIENGMRQGRIDFAVVRCLAGQTRRGGADLCALIDELGDIAPRTHPGLEQRFLELIRGAGLPDPAVNTVVEGLEVDFCWAARRVIVELDGWAFHRGRAAFEGDRRRDAHLQGAGWRVIRITHARLTTEPSAVLAQLHALLAPA